MWIQSLSRGVVIGGLLLATVLLNAVTAIPTNIQGKEEDSAVKATAVDGLKVDPLDFIPMTEASLPQSDDPEINVEAIPSNGNLKAFRPSVQFGGLLAKEGKPLSSKLKKMVEGRILQERRMSMVFPVRKFDKNSPEIQQQQQYPSSILKLFDGGNNEKENTSASVHPAYHGHHGHGIPAPAPEELEQQQPLEPTGGRPHKLYYGDLLRGAVHPQQLPQPGLEFGGGGLPPTPLPHPHAGKELELSPHSYYYPKNLMNKLPKQSVREDVHHKFQGHPHHHVQPYGGGHHEHPEHEHLAHPGLEHHHAHPGHELHAHHGHELHGHPGHGHHGHAAGHEHGGLRSHAYHHGLGNPIGPVIGKALQLLIPSALFLTGASALFPTRIHVPTNDVPNKAGGELIRNKRSPQFRSMSSMVPDEMDVVPSAYLRREHRVSEDEGIPLYDDEEDDDYLDPSATNFGERTVAAAEQMKQLLPEFKPMPPSPSSDALPVIRVNKLEPVAKKEQSNSNSSNNSTQEAPKTSPKDKATPEPKKVPTKSPQYSRAPPSRLTSATTTTTTTTSVPTTKRSKMTPQEAMSQILMATLHSHPTDPTVDSNKTGALPQVITPSSKVTVLQPKAIDSYSDASYEKPFFRRVSTETPRVMVVTPQGKTAAASNAISIAQRYKPTPRAGSSASSKPSPAFNASILKNHGPQIIELGGNDVSNNGTFAPPLDSKRNTVSSSTPSNDISEQDIDLAPDSPVVGLITNFAARDHDSPHCQKRALCELAIRGSKAGATKFERFLWNLASLVPPQLSVYYDLEDTFAAVTQRKCSRFNCANPNLDLQEAIKA